MPLLRAVAFALAALLLSIGTAGADEVALRGIIAKFADARNFAATEAVVRELAATGDPAVERPLLGLADGNLLFRKADKAVFIGKESGQSVALLDPLSGEST
ncbi:MAG: urea ABC transporter permease subunit UrtB, partial [Rhizobiaceae bacterium]